VRIGWERRSRARQGKAGRAMNGWVRNDVEWQARRGEARNGMAYHGRLGVV